MKKYGILIIITLILNLLGCVNQPAATTPNFTSIKIESSNDKTESNDKNGKHQFNAKYFYDNTLNKDNTGFRYTVIRCKDNSDRFYRVLCTYLNNCGGEIVTGFTGQINSFDSDRSILIIKLPYNAPYIEDLQQMIETYLKR